MWGGGVFPEHDRSHIIHASSQMQENMYLCFIDYAEAFRELEILERLDLYGEDT